MESLNSFVECDDAEGADRFCVWPTPQLGNHIQQQSGPSAKAQDCRSPGFQVSSNRPDAEYKASGELPDSSPVGVVTVSISPGIRGYGAIACIDSFVRKTKLPISNSEVQLTTKETLIHWSLGTPEVLHKNRSECLFIDQIASDAKSLVTLLQHKLDRATKNSNTSLAPLLTQHLISKSDEGESIFHVISVGNASFRAYTRDIPKQNQHEEDGILEGQIVDLSLSESKIVIVTVESKQKITIALPRFWCPLDDIHEESKTASPLHLLAKAVRVLDRIRIPVKTVGKRYFLTEEALLAFLGSYESPIEMRARVADLRPDWDQDDLFSRWQPPKLAPGSICSWI